MGTFGKRWKLEKPRKRWSDEALQRKSEYMKRSWANSNSTLNAEETRLKMSEAQKGLPIEVRKRIDGSRPRGSSCYNWIEDRDAVSRNRRGDAGYMEWARAVKNRDGWKCRIANHQCSEKVVAHHILSWKDFPELRYKTNNGITLCHVHHPKKRAEEKRLVQFFMGLTSVSNALN